MTKYSSAELAKLLGISKNTLLRWEEKNQIPKAIRNGRGWRVWNKNHFHEILEHKKKVESHVLKTNNQIRVSIIGYGNQAKVWAKNFKSSAYNVKILLRGNSTSLKQVFNNGFEAVELSRGLKEGAVFCLLIPDEEHETFFNTYNKLLNKDKLFVFAHGYSVHYLKIKTPVRKALLAPKAIAGVIREKFLNKEAIPTAIYTDTKNDKLLLIEMAKALGFKPLIETTFKEETVSDLFTEQALLCSTVPYFILQTFNKLIASNYSKSLALEECLNELAYIIQVIKEVGIYDFYKKISPIAFKGAIDFMDELEKNIELKELMDKTFDNIIKNKFNHRGSNKEAFLKKLKKETLCFDETLKKEVL